MLSLLFYRVEEIVCVCVCVLLLDDDDGDVLIFKIYLVVSVLLHGDDAGPGATSSIIVVCSTYGLMVMLMMRLCL